MVISYCQRLCVQYFYSLSSFLQRRFAERAAYFSTMPRFIFVHIAYWTLQPCAHQQQMNINIHMQSLFWSDGLKRIRFKQHSSGSVSQYWVYSNGLNHRATYTLAEKSLLLIVNAWNESNRPSCSFMSLSYSQLLCSDASYVFIQGEAQRAPSGEAEAGGEDYGSVQSPWAQHAASSHQGQVLTINIHTPIAKLIHDSMQYIYQQASAISYTKAVQSAVDLKQL